MWRGANDRYACVDLCVGLALSGPAAAADFYDWTGIYGGLNAGYASSSGNSLSATINGGQFDGTTGAGWSGFSAPTAGFQAGANYQFNSLVFGAEGDFDWLGKSAGVASPLASTLKVQYLDTARARLGYAFGNFLLFGSGGVAAISSSDTVTSPISYSHTASSYGWVAGGGLEYALTKNWIIRAEYLYLSTNMNFGSFVSPISCSAPGPRSCLGTVYSATNLSESAKFNESLIRFGFNFKIP